MQFWEAPAGPELSRVVERISFSSDPSPPAEAVSVVPDGCTDLLLSIEDDSARLDVFGIKTRPLLVRDARPAQKMALHLLPGTARAAFGIAAAELRDRSLAAEDLWGPLARRLLDRALQTSSWEERRGLLLAALREALRSDSCTPPAIVGAALQEIAEARGQLRVSELARRVGATPRRLERAFREHVGTSPKAHCRVVRFQAASRALARGERAAQVAIDAGYADQPHMIRELESLGGATPTELG